MVNIASAGNTWFPSLYIILTSGYIVENLDPDIVDVDALNYYFARKDDKTFIAWNFTCLLGLISIWENLGDNLIDRVKEGEKIRLGIEIIEYKEYEDEDEDL